MVKIRMKSSSSYWRSRSDTLLSQLSLFGEQQESHQHWPKASPWFLAVAVLYISTTEPPQDFHHKTDELMFVNMPDWASRCWCRRCGSRVFHTTFLYVWIMLWSTREGNEGKVSPALTGEAIDDNDYQIELKHLPMKYSGLALPNTADSTTLNHQASKDLCSHLISAVKDETTFETGKNTWIMAAAKAAIRTAKDILHEREHHRSNTSTKQTQHSQKPRNRQVATHPTKLQQWNLPLWNRIQRCIASSIL